MSYLGTKELNKDRLKDLHLVETFDLLKYVNENPELEQMVNLIIIAITRGSCTNVKNYKRMTNVIEKEEILNNIFRDKEETI